MVVYLVRLIVFIVNVVVVVELALCLCVSSFFVTGWEVLSTLFKIIIIIIIIIISITSIITTNVCWGYKNTLNSIVILSLLSMPSPRGTPAFVATSRHCERWLTICTCTPTRGVLSRWNRYELQAKN